MPAAPSASSATMAPARGRSRRSHGRRGAVRPLSSAAMGPTRSNFLGAALLVGVLLFLMLVLVIWAIPPGGPPALQ